MEHLVQVIRKTVSQGSTGHLLHKINLPRLEYKADVSNIQKLT